MALIESPSSVSAPPDAPILILTSVSTGQISIGWTLSRESVSHVTGYTVTAQRERRVAAAMSDTGDEAESADDEKSRVTEKVSAPAPINFALRGLQCGTQYVVFVVAHNQVGDSDKSNIVNVKTVGSGQ